MKMEKEFEKLSVLLIEDNGSDAQLMRIALDMLTDELEIVWLKDGEEAFNYFLDEKNRKKWGHDHTSLILIDLKMPKINGLEFLQLMKQRFPDWLSSVYITVMTSSELFSDREKAFELGASDFKVKPMDFDSILNLIKQLVAEAMVKQAETMLH